MNPYQVMGVIVCCVLMFVGVVTFLTVQGMPLPLAFLSVYLSALWVMRGMQRRARESYGCEEHPRRRHREPSVRETLSVDVPVASVHPGGVAALHEPDVRRDAGESPRTVPRAAPRRETFRA